ncbi:WD40 repeat domain-containing protein, partial [Planctomycetota bacterium]
AWMMEWVAFCPDGKRIAVVGDDYTVKIIPLMSHENEQSYSGHSNTVSQIVWHPDGIWFATLSEDNTIRLWNRNQENAVKVLASQLKPSNMAFTGDGIYLIVCYREYHAEKLTVNDLIEGKNHEGIIVDLDSTGMVITVSQDGQYIATGLWNGEILLSDGDYEELVLLEGPVGIIQDVAFTTDGTRLASISDDRTIRFWDTASGREILEIGYEGYYLNDIAFSGDGKKLLVCEKTNALTVHDASPMEESQDEKPVVLSMHSGAVISIDYNQSGDRLITSGGGGTVIWDALKGTAISSIEVDGMGTYSGQFNRDANLIADCCIQKGIPAMKVWDTQHPHQERFSVKFVEEKSAVAFSHDSQYLVIGGEDRVLHVYDWKLNKRIGELGRQDDWIVKITTSPNGKYLASTGYSGTLKIWDVTQFEKPQECGWDYNGGCIFRPDFSPDDKYLAVGGYEGTIKILDVESGEEVRIFPNAHGGMVHCLSFSPDGRFLASGGSDKTVRIWEIQTGRLVDVLLGHKGIILSVAFSPDGKHVASGEMYSEARIWTPNLE